MHQVFQPNLARLDTEAKESTVRRRLVPLAALAALAASCSDAPRAFGGVSDFFHVRDVPGIVMGPGRSDQSHAADEWIEVAQLEQGVAQYRATIERYFA